VGQEKCVGEDRPRTPTKNPRRFHGYKHTSLTFLVEVFSEGRVAPV